LVKNKWMPLLISLLALTNLMCLFSAYDIDEEKFTRIKPDAEKLAGNYVPTKETMKLIKEVGLYSLQDISITIYSDGTFEMQNMPDWWMTPYGDSNGGTDSGKGTWKINSNRDWWEIYFDFDAGGTFSSRENFSNGFSTAKDMSGNQPPYSFWFYIGDPDRGRVMIFEQIVQTP